MTQKVKGVFFICQFKVNDGFSEFSFDHRDFPLNSQASVRAIHGQN